MEDTQEQPTPDLSRLLAAAAMGDETAWRQVVDLYTRRIFALAKSRIHRIDLAEEITQSVFVTVATKLPAGGYTEQGKFESWLFRIAINRIRDEIRRLRRHAEPTDPERFGSMAEANENEKSRSEFSAMLPRLRSALAMLTESDREIIELRHHAGLSFNQIAEMEGEPLGTLLARHHRALKKLKDLMTNPASSPALETES